MLLDLTSVNREWKNPMMQQHISEIVIQKLFKFLNCFLCSISNFLNKKKQLQGNICLHSNYSATKKYTVYIISHTGSRS